MSGYPPPPYGVPFHANGQMPPQMGNYNPAMVQHPYQHQNQASYLYGHSQPNGVSPALHANAYSFQANAQDSRATAPSNGVNHGHTFSGYSGQAPYTALLPPPYPPIPIPFGVPSHVPQYTSQPPPRVSTASAPHFPPLKTSNPQFSSIANLSTPQPQSPALPELEDGEVDDTGSDETVNRPEAASMGSVLSRPSGGEQVGSEGSTTSPTHINEMSQTLRPDQDSYGKSNRNIAISSPQPQRPMLQNGFLERSCDSPSSQLMDDLSRSHNVEQSVKGTPEQPAMLTHGKAHEARQALHDLHSKGYHFNQIVEKGLNPAILKELYTEIGVPVTASPSAQQQQQQHHPVLDPFKEDTQMTRTSDTVTVGNNNSGQPQHLKDTSHVAKPPHNDKAVLSKDNGNSLPSAATAKDEKAPNNLAKQAKHPSGKVLGMKAGESKVADRKEYIARMLAAKAGKPAPSAATLVLPKAITSMNANHVASANPVAQTNTSPKHSTSNPIAISSTIQTPPASKISILPQVNKEEVEAEAKRKAQTDLARQKIEALKLRESKQQEARIAASNESKREFQQPPSSTQTQGLIDRSAIAPQRTVSRRQGSYFSPTSQKPPFSIPGLFMTSDALQSTETSKQTGSPVLETSPQQKISHASFPVVEQQPHSRPLHSPNLQSAAVESTSSLNHTSNTTASTLPLVSGTPTVNHRKRQKAADFIDSPSTRTKRPLGKQEHDSVIIDISEDDASSLADESLDTDVEHERNGRSLQLRSGGFENETQKSFRDLPPLTETPGRRKAAALTPPATQIPAQAKDSKGLRTKEIEIEQMNRRIKELEQRITAKKSTSRAQTPGASGSVMVSSPASQSSQNAIEQPSALTGVARSANQPTSLTPTRHSSLPIIDTTKSATEDQLVAEQQLQEVELAKAEVECELALDAIRISQGNGGTQEDALEDLIRNGQQRLREDEDQQAQKERGIKTREAHDKQWQQRQYLVEDEKRHLQEERRRLRKTKIESDLPIIDAIVGRSREKLESLRKEMEDLEKEVQKGMEDKKLLTDELHHLSQTTATLELPAELPAQFSTTVETQVATNGESTANLSSASALPEKISAMAFQRDSRGISISPERLASPRAAHISPSPSNAKDETPADGELEEDVMDISRSDIDEGEITELSQGSIAEALEEDSNMNDDEESYEPPSDMNTNRDLLHGVQNDDKSTAAEYNMLDDVSMVETDSGNVLELPLNNQEVTKIIGGQHEEYSAHRSPPLIHASDDEDYEPPEPPPFAKETALPTAIPVDDSEICSSPLQTKPLAVASPIHLSSQPVPLSDSKEETLVANSPENLTHQSLRQIGHFIPYESPLKQFKAFRYHPNYLNEVSTGFRSLTYSHTINAEQPICQYELGGICNDNSCESQHIKSMSDEKILVDLGSVPDGLSQEEAEAFTNSLRELIQTIRSRRIKDVNVVAREITAHRARFLGDQSKVLPL